MARVQLRLRKGKSPLLVLRSPWIFSGALQYLPTDVEPGTWIDLLDEHGQFSGSGHFHPSSIAVRILAHHHVFDLPAFYVAKIAQAYHLRERLGFTDQLQGAYRLVHGEGDGLSGLIIDIYGPVAVIQCHTVGMWRDLPYIVSGILGLPTSWQAIYFKSKDLLDQSQVEDGLVYGSQIQPVEVVESGLAYQVDVVQGQKTGLFLDQRINRALMVQYSAGKNVLNTFCYTGGFSLAALHGGASQVTSVDQSAWAVAETTKHVNLNFGREARHQAVHAKVLPFFQDCKSSFDLIVVDPPAYAKSQDKRHNALKAYTRLNYEAITHLAPGGLLFTFSCSQVVNRELFEGAVLSAAMLAKREARIIHYLQQSPDHPVNIFHREGLYLKGLLMAFDD